MKFRSLLPTVAALALGLPSALQAEYPTIHLLPLGDSLTAGVDYWNLTGKGGYRRYLEDNLQTSGINFEFVGFRDDDGEGDGGNFIEDPDHEGWGGHYLDGVNGDGSTASLRKGIKDFERIQGQPIDAILLMAGTNDVAWFPGAQASQSELRDRYNRLLNEIYDQNDNVLIIVSKIPRFRQDTSVPLASDAEVTAFNDVIDEIVIARQAEGHRITAIDGYSELSNPTTDLQATSSTENPDTGQKVPDGVHPSDAGYKKLGNLWFRAVEPVYWEVDSLYKDSVPLSGDWRWSPTFKSFNDQGDKTAGWKYHETLGWMYTPDEDTANELYMYTEELGWLYTNRSTYPDVYRFDRGAWFFFNESTDRALFNYSTNSWEGF